MNQCMEIQARIPDYIEGNLSTDELEEFITHIESCDECKEELNIYYTIYLGLLQLDHEDRDIKELNDLDGALAEELCQSELFIRRRHFWQGFRYVIYTTAFWCVVVSVLFELRLLCDAGIL